MGLLAEILGGGWMSSFSLTSDVGGLGVNDSILEVVDDAEPVDAADAQPAGVGRGEDQVMS